MNTDDLIRQIAGANRPVQRLHPPWVRALLWLAVSGAYVAFVVWLHPYSPPFRPVTIMTTQLMVEWSAALVTAMAAALAAFCSTVPGYDRRILWLPVLPAAVWVATLGVGCVNDWLLFGARGLALRSDWSCLPPAIVIGSVPLVLILVMLQYGAPLRPRISVALAALAVAGLGNAGLRLFHPGDASIMILVWHVGVAFALTALAGLLGQMVLNWRRAWRRALPQ